MKVDMTKSEVQEQEGKFRNSRELVLEGIRLLHEVYGANELRRFNDLVCRSQTFDEVRMAADMLLVMGMFADMRDVRDGDSDTR